ncbi:MAG: galactitol-1-phosphate 5-dehydrogenase [Acidobacteria bacterium]|nr:MAG: galactitol-1-phosphate 5-dehydrogenase [Acidobacteria bacterium 13_2_20CM_58_27]PYT67672.1 MAG: galactitol-1-phosphate 5-dehydrogenase [Acidobacteriota bacterium]PYT90821.1 MAG: galactitol-1-phosphate 5-dehydrogenase [Acidobacteriota bacterium]
MKALLLSKNKHLEMTDLPVPRAEPGEVLVRVAACGICGSDVHGYDGSSGRRIPPIVMGHEAAGRIAAIGSGVTGFTEGDRVTFDSTVYCGTCGYCRRGEVNLCDNRQVLGVSCADYRRAGAFAEFVAVPSRIVYRLPDNLSFEEAAMLEAVSVAIHAVSLAPLSAGSTALVVGAGMIGLLIVQVLRAAGCSRILVTDIDSSRLKLAQDVGAHTVLSATLDVARQVGELTRGAGVDAAIEAVGQGDSVKASIESVRKGGTVVLVGNIAPEVMVPLQKIVTRQIRLQGSCASAGEYPRAMELLESGAIQVKNLITAIAPLEEGPLWFERLHAREPNVMKVVLRPGEVS